MKKKVSETPATVQFFIPLKKRFKSFLFYYFFFMLNLWLCSYCLLSFIQINIINSTTRTYQYWIFIFIYYHEKSLHERKMHKGKKISVKMLSVLIVKNKNLIVDITVSTTIKIVFNYLENNFILAIFSPLLSVLND